MPSSRVFEKIRDDTQNSSTRIFDLPTLTIDQLLTAFQEMDLEVTERDLLHPTAEHTEQIFLNILHQLKPSVYEEIESAELPLDELDFEPVDARNLLVYSRMRALLKDIGFTDFELLDMTHPAPHRLARIMSALVNYATFRDRRWEFFEQGMIESDRLMEKVHQEEQAIAKAESRLLVEREEMPKIEHAIQQLEAESQTEAYALREIAKTADELIAEANEHKKQRGRLKDEMEEAQFNLLQLLNQLNPTKSLLDIGPQEKQATLAKLKKSLQYEEQKVEQMMQQSEEQKQQLDNLQDIIRSLDLARQRLWDAKRDKGDCIQTEEEERAMIHEEQNVNAQRESIRQTQQNVQRSLNLLATKQEKEREQLAIFNDNYPLKHEAAQKTVRQLSEEAKELEKQRKEIQATLNECDMEIVSAEAAAKEELQKWMDEYELLMEELNSSLKIGDTS
ncbi:hypothetical protein O0I10_004706 [Lichtheimia ornata]|uniref:Kinetochore protein Nuf2 N-terminal domain-containing protein n=1 Tax=Lichtheimia ornata TaxID=688661 RepID=A0AAD7V5H7_9FUNG|nr:uncharacterized protein O0I10_004706 [Lichtheimia ornata]KAJ8659724.1 hypothetical protein O0I10_004706 [Lichtheimia ornata]